MDNKKLGIILIIISLLLAILLFFVRTEISTAYQLEIDRNLEEYNNCHIEPNSCPHEERARAEVPIYIGLAVLLGIIALGVYLIFFEKSQKEIVSTLQNQKKMQVGEEKFQILLKGLDADEKKVILAVKEQDGITQATLRLRTDMHKSKLSIVLDGLEKKGLIKRIDKGKTKEVFLKIDI